MSIAPQKSSDQGRSCPIRSVGELRRQSNPIIAIPVVALPRVASPWRSHRAANWFNQSCLHRHEAAYKEQLATRHGIACNQLLALTNMPIKRGAAPVHLSDLLDHDVENRAIRVADHCYGCTAGQGSSCAGALDIRRGAANTGMNS